MCSLSCSESPSHKAECKVFREKKILPHSGQEMGKKSLFPIVSLLRMVLVEDTKKKEQIATLMSQWSERAKQAGVVEGIQKVGEFFQQRCGLDVSMEWVQHCYGVIKTNAMSLGKDQDGEAIYPLAAMLSHACAANLEPVR